MKLIPSDEKYGDVPSVEAARTLQMEARLLRRASGARPLPRMHFPLAAMRGNWTDGPTYALRVSCAHAFSVFGSTFFRTAFDPEPIVSVPVNTLTMVEGGAGAGKGAQIITPMLALVDEPILYVDPQREAGEDVPLRVALGRTVFVFDSRRENSASTNVLAGLSPEQSDFEEVVGLIVDDLVPEGDAEAKTEEGRKYTRLALTVVIANEILFSLAEGRAPSLAQAVSHLGSDEIVDAMAFFAENGLLHFRKIAAGVHFDVANDPEARGGVASFVRRDLSWLENPAYSRLVTGETDIVADPRDMLGDRLKCDWFLQPGENLERTASLWRVLIGSVRRERRKITKAQAAAIGTPTWFVVDEFPSIAGAGAKTFDHLVVTDRQKRCLPVYIYQHEEQITQIFGKGKLDTWRGSASLRIALAPDAKTARSFSEDCGSYYRCEMFYSGDGEGPQAQAQRQWTPTPAVPESDLAWMRLGSVAARYTDPDKRTFTVIDNGPLFFRMPLFRRYVERCKKRHPYLFEPYVDWNFMDWDNEEQARGALVMQQRITKHNKPEGGNFAEL